MIGSVMFLLAVSRRLSCLARIVPKEVVRGIQLGFEIDLATLALKDFAASEQLQGEWLALVSVFPKPVLGIVLLFKRLRSRRWCAMSRPIAMRSGSPLPSQPPTVAQSGSGGFEPSQARFVNRQAFALKRRGCVACCSSPCRSFCCWHCF